jgi:carotenoid phi-ring synthase / carotenoid chi-ring synthase
MTETSDSFPVVIIGGGLAGLTAAVHLADRGIQPLVLEASSLWPGGRLCGGDADTFEYQGRTWSFTPDHGVHALWGGYHNMRAMLASYLDIELKTTQGEEWINRWGREVRAVEAGNAVRSRWLPAPLHYLQLLFRPHFWTTITPLDFLSLPGFLASILWTVGYDPIEEKSRLQGLTMREYFRGWTPNLRATFTGLGVNLLAAPAETISVSSLIAALRFYTILRRDSWGMDFLPGNSHDYLIQPLIDAIEARGGRVSLGATAQYLEGDGTSWRVVIEDDSRRGLRSAQARHVILAVQAPAAQRLLLAGADTAPQAEQIVFPGAVRSLAVRLWFDRQPRDGAASGMFTGDFEVDNFFWLHRLYNEFAAWRDIGGSAVEIHIYGSEKTLDQPDRNLLITAINEIQRAFPELRGHYVHGVVRRNSRTHTIFQVPDRTSLHVDTPWDGLYACGDWIGYDSSSLWMERATATGIAAANRVLESHHCEPFPILKQKPPEILARSFGGIVRILRLVGYPLFALLRGLRRITRR